MMKDEQDLSSALFIGWKNGYLGREQFALGLLQQASVYFNKLKNSNEIASVDVVVLQPYGGDLNGFMLLRGSNAQIEAVQRQEAFSSIVGQGMFCLDGFCIVSGMAGISIGQTFQKNLRAVAGLSSNAAEACSPEGAQAIGEMIHTQSQTR